MSNVKQIKSPTADASVYMHKLYSKRSAGLMTAATLVGGVLILSTQIATYTLHLSISFMCCDLCVCGGGGMLDHIRTTRSPFTPSQAL